MSLIPTFEIGVWNAWILMSSFVLQMLAVLLLGRGVWARSPLPSGIKRSKLEKFTLIMGNSVWLLATIYSIFLPLQLGTLWFYIGLPVFLAGLVILTVATVNFATAPVQKPATKGAYYFSTAPALPINDCNLHRHRYRQRFVGIHLARPCKHFLDTNRGSHRGKVLP